MYKRRTVTTCTCKRSGNLPNDNQHYPRNDRRHKLNETLDEILIRFNSSILPSKVLGSLSSKIAPHLNVGDLIDLNLAPTDIDPKPRTVRGKVHSINHHFTQPEFLKNLHQSHYTIDVYVDVEFKG